MTGGGAEDLLREMLERQPMSVRAEWKPPAISAVSPTTIRTLAVADVGITVGFWTERTKVLLVCEGPDGSPWVVGVVGKERTRWGIRQRGAIVLGDATAIVRWNAGHEQMEISRVGVATRRTRGIEFLWHRPCEYTVSEGPCVGIHVPGLFFDDGLRRWQFGLAGSGESQIQLRAGSLRGWTAAIVDSMGLKEPDPRGLLTTDSAGFPVLHRVAVLGSPLFSGAVAKSLESASEPLRLLAVMSAIWERTRHEASGGVG